MELYFALLVELVWGVAYAYWLEKARLGIYLAREETWITVVIGVAGAGLIGAIVLDWRTVGIAALLFAASSVGIIGRSLINNERRFSDRWQQVRRIGRDDETGT